MDTDSPVYEPTITARYLLYRTYRVTIIMLIFGWIQVAAVMEVDTIKNFLKENSYISVIQFFVSFLSIQLYVFFFHVITKLSKWKRLLAAFWTFEMNTISVMKTAKKGNTTFLLAATLLTILMIIISKVYGEISSKHRRGLFIKRYNVIRWSERLFVLTSFGIIVCSEMNRDVIEFPTLFVYTMMSNIFVVIFAGSMHRPGFYHMDSPHDNLLIGQLYYLNFFALFMGYELTMIAGWQIHKVYYQK